MKRKTLIVGLSVSLLAVGYGVQKMSSQNVLADLALENIEALARSEANANGNTGPSELFDCPLWFTGDGIHCKCENTSNCTAVLCD